MFSPHTPINDKSHSLIDQDSGRGRASGGGDMGWVEKLFFPVVV